MPMCSPDHRYHIRRHRSRLSCVDYSSDLSRGSDYPGAFYPRRVSSMFCRHQCSPLYTHPYCKCGQYLWYRRIISESRTDRWKRNCFLFSSLPRDQYSYIHRLLFWLPQSQTTHPGSPVIWPFLSCPNLLSAGPWSSSATFLRCRCCDRYHFPGRRLRRYIISASAGVPQHTKYWNNGDPYVLQNNLYID